MAFVDKTVSGGFSQSSGTESNSSRLNELYVVEYPALVKDEIKAVESLGGILNVSQVLSGEKKRMELNFKRNNVYSKPAFGDVQQNSGILLKVKIRRKKPNPELASGSSNQQPDVSYSVEILGYSKNIVRFNCPYDYQYLPILKNPKTNHMEYIYDSIVPKGIPTMDWFKKRDQPLFCVPAIFSKDTVYCHLFRKIDENEKDDGTLGLALSRNRDSKVFEAFSLTESFPTQPSLTAAKKMTVKFVTDVQLQKVKQLFEECPIWTRIAILYESKIHVDKFKFILPVVAYYFTTGPWRTMWVRYGYDPRKHFESRYYQLFDYRLRSGLGMSEYVKIKSNARREIYGIKSTKYKRNIVTQEKPKVFQDVEYPYFDEGTLPRSRQCHFRYCDIRLPKIKEMLEKIPTPLSGASCNEKTGWLPPGFDEQCRQIINDATAEHFQLLRMEEGTNMEDEEDAESEDDNEFNQMIKENLEDMDVD